MKMLLRKNGNLSRSIEYVLKEPVSLRPIHIVRDRKVGFKWYKMLVRLMLLHCSVVRFNFGWRHSAAYLH